MYRGSAVGKSKSMLPPVEWSTWDSESSVDLVVASWQAPQRTQIDALPDVHPRLLGAVHRVARPHAERLVERRQVAQRADDAQMVRRVHVGLHLERERLGPDLGHPAERPADEVALRRREAADRLALPGLRRAGERLPAVLDAAEVGDGLALRLFAVDAQFAGDDVA